MFVDFRDIKYVTNVLNYCKAVEMKFYAPFLLHVLTRCHRFCRKMYTRLGLVFVARAISPTMNFFSPLHSSTVIAESLRLFHVLITVYIKRKFPCSPRAIKNIIFRSPFLTHFTDFARGIAPMELKSIIILTIVSLSRDRVFI